MSSSRGSSHPGIKPRSALQVDSLLSEPTHAYSRRGLSRGEFSIELEQRSTESKPSLTDLRRVNIMILFSTWVGALVPMEVKVSDCYVHFLTRN